MRHTHVSTPRERVAWVSYLLAHAGEYGVGTALSRTMGVSRQTLYAWVERGRAALEQVFAPPVAAADADLERHILTLLVEGHASYRGIRCCLRQVGQRQGSCGNKAVNFPSTVGINGAKSWSGYFCTTPQVSLGTISAVVRAAERLALVAQLALPQERAVALDEIDGPDRQGAYLTVVDVHSGAVWLAEGPLPVDGETWTLALWLPQERGLRWHTTASDGGTAMEQVVRTVDPGGRTQQDRVSCAERVRSDPGAGRPARGRIGGAHGGGDPPGRARGGRAMPAWSPCAGRQPPTPPRWSRPSRTPRSHPYLTVTPWRSRQVLALYPTDNPCQSLYQGPAGRWARPIIAAARSVQTATCNGGRRVERTGGREDRCLYRVTGAQNKQRARTVSPPNGFLADERSLHCDPWGEPAMWDGERGHDTAALAAVTQRRYLHHRRL